MTGRILVLTAIDDELDKARAGRTCSWDAMKGLTVSN